MWYSHHVVFQLESEKLLDDISSSVIHNMVKTLESKDVMTIDAALRDATAKMRPQLKELARLKGLTVRKAARLVSKRVSHDKRLLEAVTERQKSGEGAVATRSSAASFARRVNSLVYKALTVKSDVWGVKLLNKTK